MPALRADVAPYGESPPASRTTVHECRLANETSSSARLRFAMPGMDRSSLVGFTDSDGPTPLHDHSPLGDYTRVIGAGHARGDFDVRRLLPQTWFAASNLIVGHGDGTAFLNSWPPDSLTGTGERGKEPWRPNSCRRQRSTDRGHAESRSQKAAGRVATCL
jgi:hypothetical protein